MKFRSGSTFLDPGVGSSGISVGIGVTVGSASKATSGLETSSGGRVRANTAPPATSSVSTRAAAPRSHFFLGVMGEAG